MKIKWLFEAQNEFRDFLTYYKASVRLKFAQAFYEKILSAVSKFEPFPEIGVLKTETLMGKYGFRALFIDHYVCVYKIDGDTIYIFHLADARKNYIYNIFGFED